MYFVVCAGGTAGHVNPALALATQLRDAGHDILFIGTNDHIEKILSKDAGFDFVGIEVSGFDSAHPSSLVSASYKILKASKKVKKLFKEHRPDAVVSFGAYVSIPVGRAAAAFKIPYIIHEQNSVPGIANKYLARYADVTVLAYRNAQKYLKPKHKVMVLGNPVRASFDHCSAVLGRKLCGVPQNALMLLIFGGSLGAQHLNAALCALKKELLAIKDLYIVQSSGEKDYKALTEALALSEEEQKRWKVLKYIKDMGNVLAAADLVISRSGASSVAEIMTVARPVIFVPYPYARADHQTTNAASAVAAGAAYCVDDASLNDPSFYELIVKLLKDPAKRASMAQATALLSGKNARLALAELVCEIAQKGRRKGSMSL